MRGLVFTEFLDFVEDTAGPETLEAMIEACNLSSGGAYTAVGYYDHAELVAMLGFLEQATGQAAANMLRAFGRRLFATLAEAHRVLLGDGEELLDFLDQVEGHIHHEVRKLYPDAELPRIDTERPAPDRLILHYRSSRPFAALAHGMIEGAAEHFEIPLTITPLGPAAAQGGRADFELRAA
ncbi:MAG: hypothetical protein D6811_13400 [Alphaproteobacteria bacterium]|nr:MAG: hypothetical protein D6811_13400 [Alphaproteobacteria bacterium]